jgi:hypothetical protein
MKFDIQDEVKSSLKSGNACYYSVQNACYYSVQNACYYSVQNACYYSVQNLLASRLLSKNLTIRIYRTIILPVVLYGCETWSLILKDERRLRVFENMVLRRIFGSKRDEVTGEWRKLHNGGLNDLGGGCSGYGGGEVCTGFWWVNLRERGRWGDPGVDGKFL